MSQRETVYIGVGANLGFAEDAVLNALADLGELPDTEFLCASGLYRSAPQDAEGPDFINAAAQLATGLDPEALLAHLLAIEARHGRVRTTRNAPRTLDLDLLLYGTRTIATAGLVVPHPRMTSRAFVLLPLLEIEPALVIPGHGPAQNLLAALGGQSVTRLVR